MADRIRWATVPRVHIPRAKCPYCSTLDAPVFVKSTDQGDGSIYRRLICKRCSSPWALVLDPDEVEMSTHWNCEDDDLQ